MLRLFEQTAANVKALSLAVLALLAVGVVMVFSAGASLDSPGLADQLAHSAGARQVLHVLLAAAVMAAVCFMPYRWWRLEPGRWWSASVLLLVVAVLCLLLVFVPGVGLKRNEALRWIRIGPVSFQPSELAKLALVIFLAGYLSGGRAVRQFWRGLAPACAVAGLLILLVGLEDFGTAALLAVLTGALLLVGGARLVHLGLLACPALAALAALVVFWPYRVHRLVSFLDPWANPGGSGYHAIQSLITVASGGWFGTGLGAGIQKYGYLPHARSDFIFAVICEELGWMGAVGVVGLFLVLIWQGRKTMLAAGDPLGRLLAFGVTWLIGLQTVMNIAVATVSVPTKGIALPLVSAGGSGLLVFGAAMGVLLSVAREAGRQTCPTAR